MEDEPRLALLAQPSSLRIAWAHKSNYRSTSVVISNLDQVSITHRMGMALPSPLRFKIVRLDDGIFQRTLYLARAGQGAQQ